jgi:micrococcal nuclease
MPRHITAILFLFLAMAPVKAADTALTGTVDHVRDGDTIEVGNIAIRLNGVSAPELDEHLGPQSKNFMQELVLNKTIRCELNGEKTYDRVVGVCYLEGKDIGISVIENGLALDCPKYSHGHYSKYETAKAREEIELPDYCR